MKTVGRSTVVVVNDDPSQLRSYAEMLQKDGFRVCAFQTAEEALGHLRREGAPAVVVTDLAMPGIDGWRFCRLLRSPEFAAVNQTPVLVLSATFSGADAEQVTQELGANAFLGAPCQDAVLRAYVRALAQGSAPRRTPAALIVEDSPTTAKALRQAFEAHGYAVAVAATAAEARALHQQRAPVFAVIDYHLPDEAGDRLLDAFRRPESSTAAIFITTDPSPELATQLMQAGADAYVRKPFDPEYVIELCERVGRERALRRLLGLVESRTRDLRQAEERFRGLFDDMPEAVLAHNREGVVLAANDAACRLFETTREELVGLTMDALLDRRHAADAAARIETALAGVSCSFECTYVSRRGRHFEAEVSQRPAEFDGRPAVLCVVRDISQRRRVEEQRRQFECKMRHVQRFGGLGMLTAGLARELGLLFGEALNCAEAALEQTPEDAPERPRLKRIEKAAKRGGRVTAALVEYTRRGGPDQGPVHVTRLIAEIAPLFEAAAMPHTRINYSLAPDLPEIAADPSQVRQLALNLFLNAAEAVGAGEGSVTIMTSATRLTADACQRLCVQAPAGDYVCIEVADTGVGMDSRALSRLFEPFYTTKAAGRGLGLAAVRAILRGMGGGLEARSEPGRGSTFRAYLPVGRRARPEGEDAEDTDEYKPV